jgi:hypothetical protein
MRASGQLHDQVTLCLGKNPEPPYPMNGKTSVSGFATDNPSTMAAVATSIKRWGMHYTMKCVGMLIHHYSFFYNPVQPDPILSLTNTVNTLIHYGNYKRILMNILMYIMAPLSYLKYLTLYNMPHSKNKNFRSCISLHLVW